MSQNRGKQKRLAAQKKKREKARSTRSRPALNEQAALRQLVREARVMPEGPAWISVGWDKPEDDHPELVSVLVTRKLPAGQVLPMLMMVDRTCLGVKNALIAIPMSAAPMSGFVASLRDSLGGFDPISPSIAKSIVYHALDYAKSLGFEPHEDFEEELLGPRPDVLVETPYARPQRPIYMSGPDDDVDAILKQLEGKNPLVVHPEDGLEDDEA